MKLIKYIVAGATLVFAVTASASSISPTDFTTQTISDNYIGAGARGDVYGETKKYDVDKMTVKRQGTTMTVDIFTSFWDNIGQDGIKLGDLFMATGSGNDNPWDPYGSGKHRYDRSSSTSSHNSGTDWNYVYDLEGGRSRSNGQGHLKSGFNRSDLYTSSDLTQGGRRNDQAVRIRDRSHQTTHSTSNWAIGSTEYFIGSTSYRNLRLTFDVAGTALATAHQIAFRWTMTCANDIIEGLVSVTPNDNTTPIPAPQTIALMLLGLAGLSLRKKA